MKGLQHMAVINLIGLGQIGNGLCQTQAAVNQAGRPTVLGSAAGQVHLGCIADGQGQQLWGAEGVVAHALAPERSLVGGLTAKPDLSATFAGLGLCRQLGWQGRHRYPHIHTV